MDKPGLAGEVGIHQIKPSTASDPGNMPGIDPRTLHDPRVNINFAADYLKSRVGPNADFSNPATVAAALRAYNGGGDPNYIANVNRYRTARVSQPTPAAAAGPRTALTSLRNNPNAPIPSPTANSPPSSPMPPSVVPQAQAAPAPAAPAAATPVPAPAPAPSPGPVVQRSAQGGSEAQTAANNFVENKLRLAKPGGEDAYKDIMANAVNGNVTLKQTPGGLRIIGKSGKEYN
jgi:hypothetical protein